jgi:hypothetical protein
LIYKSIRLLGLKLVNEILIGIKGSSYAIEIDG